MELNEAYALYRENPEVNKEVFGEELIKFCRQFTRKRSKDPAGMSSESSWCTTEDVSSDAALYVWENLAKYNPEKGMSFKTWVGMIIIADLKDVYRKYNRHNEVELSDVNVSYEPHRSIESKLTVKKLLSTLNKEDRAFISLILDGYTHKEVALYYKRDAEDTRWVESKWNYLKKKLREML